MKIETPHLAPVDRVAAAHAAIAQSSIFRLNGPEIDLPAALLTLAHAVHDVDHTDDDDTEHMWSTIGEHTDAPLGDMIAAAYWTLSDWHAGQSSPEYAALSALSSIYSPSMADGPEPDTCESDAAEMFAAWFRDRTAPPFQLFRHNLKTGEIRKAFPQWEDMTEREAATALSKFNQSARVRYFIAPATSH